MSGSNSAGPGHVPDPQPAQVRLRQGEHVAQADHADHVVDASGPPPGSGSVRRPSARPARPASRRPPTVATRGRGIIAARAGRSAKSSTRSSSVDSSGGRSPLSRDSSMIASRSRGVAACSTSCTGSMPHRPQQQVRRGVEHPDQPAEQPQVDPGGQGQRAGHRLRPGDRQVLREQLTEHHLHHGGEQQRQHGADGDPDRRWAPGHARAARRARPDQRLGDVPDDQPGDRDAQLGPGEHERGAAGDRPARVAAPVSPAAAAARSRDRSTAM